HSILMGTVPERILLLTFTRRAAAEMTRRAQRILAEARAGRKTRSAAAFGEICWSGTFHAIGNRLLREHTDSIGFDPSFTVLDRADAADRLNFVRNELGLAKTEARFQRKDTCSLSTRTRSMPVAHWPRLWNWLTPGVRSGKP